MLIVGAICAVLVILTTLVHYEALRGLGKFLPLIGIPTRAKLVVVIITAFVAHAAEILLYACAYFLLVRHTGLGSLAEAGRYSFDAALYFSAETYTSLGYGDVIPSGDLRMLAGVEALNGLLLIGWSASYTYLAMERFWGEGGTTHHKNDHGGSRGEQ